MAEIDYAFLADFAKVEPNGTLTSVGASFTYLTAPAFPSAHRIAIAGRVRARVHERDIPFRITFTTPNEQVRLNTEGELSPSPHIRPYGEGWLGHLFALDMQIPLPVPGLYWIEIDVGDGASVRRLAFEAGLPDL